jgi:two-component system, NtrC family, nitrogen regulation sensor histidine kinase NtrY
MVLLGLFVLALLTTLVLLQTSNLWKDLSVETASDTLLLYGLSSLNFIAFVVFGFIFLRSIVKLVRERRTLQLGSKLKTKLLIYFAAVSILPIFAMAVFSYLYMNRAIERWFTQVPENVVRKSQQVQDQAIAERNRKLDDSARMLALVVEKRGAPRNELSELAAAGGLTRIVLKDRQGSTLVEGGRPLGSEEESELSTALLAYSEKGPAAVELRDGTGYDIAAATLSDGRILIVVTDSGFDRSVTTAVNDWFREFEDLKQKQISVRQIGLLTLGVLTFLLVFASSWIAFHIARGLTTPIKALAEGAREIAGGNLGHKVDVAAEDELALLVVTFNEMSSRLEENSATLQERQRYIETILETLPTGVVSLSRNGDVETINSAAAKIFNIESRDVVGKRLSSLVDSASSTILDRVINRAARAGNASEQSELFGDRSDGQSVPVALTAAALPGGSGTVLVIEDLSELISAQRASAWREVARRMAHEIKNPLTPIQLSAERIAKKFSTRAAKQPAVAGFEAARVAGDDAESVVTEGTSTILREVQSLKAMVDEFSQFARLPEVKLEPEDLNEILRQTIALYEDRLIDVEIESKLDQNVPALLVDAEQTKRVFVNLIDNSIEAFGDEQEVKLISVSTRYDKARDLVVAEVIDNGCGFPPSALQKLFQPYFSTKNRGTGLGLAIVQRIVSDHGAKIFARTNNPRGARFVIEYPVTA